MVAPRRKTNRLRDFDYSTPGAYFITICTKDRSCILGKVVGGGALDTPVTQLTEVGLIVQRYILSGNHISGITVEKFVVMPNHIHLLLLIEDTADGEVQRRLSPANGRIPHFVSTLKRFCHRDIGEDIFQRSYHDHVIRGEKDYRKIWEYIDSNPARWQEDCFYTE